MAKVKYARFPIPRGTNEFDLELPEKSFMFVEVIDGVGYIAATYDSTSPFKKMTITLLEDGGEYEADHVADLGLLQLPLEKPKRAVFLGILPPEIKAVREAAKAGIIGATHIPRTQ